MIKSPEYFFLLSVFVCAFAVCALVQAQAHEQALDGGLSIWIDDVKLARRESELNNVERLFFEHIQLSHTTSRVFRGF